MLRPRAHFNLIAVGTTLLAFGGYNDTSIEMWGGLSAPWIEASTSLASLRSQHSALSFDHDLLCSENTTLPENFTAPLQTSWGVVVTGGLDSSNSSVSSTNVIGLDNCVVPDLPELRHNHGSFLTKWGALAVCGGDWSGKPWSSDCLVLNSTSKQWDR